MLVKTLYGLKQSGREWNIEFNTKIQAHGFTRLKSDPCAYVRRDDNGIGIITVWVDNLLLFATTDTSMQIMKQDIRSQWETTDLGEPTKIVGIEITLRDRTVMISQQQYIENILKKEGLERANSVSTPLDQNVPIEPNPEGNEGNRSNAYASLLGELQFLANTSRPDITFVVNRLAAYTANPSLQHTSALKRVLRYLAGTKSYGIMYGDTRGHPDTFHGYVDAAWANQDERKSTSGYVFLSCGGVITWKSKKQTITAQSSTEAEYIALSEASREACWLRSLHFELGFPQTGPSLIKCDNEGAIAMAKNSQFHQRSKHVDIKWHLIKDKIKENQVHVESCRDHEQTADILTKPIPWAKHTQHVKEMALAPA
jgi:hypothetical protein